MDAATPWTRSNLVADAGSGVTPPGAHADVTRATRLSPHHVDPCNHWGDVLANLGLSKEALGKYDEALQYARHWEQLKDLARRRPSQMSDFDFRKQTVASGSVESTHHTRVFGIASEPNELICSAPPSIPS